MFCGSCGKPITQEDAFCGSCGAKVERVEQVVQQEVAAAQEAIPVHTIAPAEPAPAYEVKLGSPKKWIFALCTIVVLVGAYFAARFFLLGPATPEKLQEAFNNALNAHDTAALARLIDPNQKPLQDQKAIAAFSESLNKETIANYGAGIQTAVDRVMESLKNDSSGKNPNLSFTDVSWVGLVGKSSWLGTQWYVHLPPSQIKMEESTGVKTKLTVKGMDTENGQVGMLWPSVYEYEVEASNDFASRKAKEEANFLDMVGSYNNDMSKTLTHPVSVQGMFPTLTVYFPEDPGAKVKLNGKELPAGQQSMALMPAPDKAEFHVTANVSGQNVQRSVTVNPAQESEVNLQTVLNEANDEIAAAQQGVQNTIYTYLNERIGAINYNDFGRISSIMVPNSEIYNYNKDLIARYVAKGIQESLGSYDITNITKVDDGVYKADAYEQVTYYYTDGTQETKDFRFRYTVKYDGSTGIISAREEIK